MGPRALLVSLPFGCREGILILRPLHNGAGAAATPDGWGAAPGVRAGRPEPRCAFYGCAHGLVLRSLFWLPLLLQLLLLSLSWEQRPSTNAE